MLSASVAFVGACSGSGTAAEVASVPGSTPTSTPEGLAIIADERVEAATLRLEVTECTSGVTNRATAVVIDGGSVVSVAHTFVNSGSPVLWDNTGHEFAATLTYLDPEQDLAVFEVEPGLVEGLPLSNQAQDRSVRFVSFVEDKGPTIQQATVLRYTRLTLDGVGDRAGIELEAPIRKGDSGGPVISDEGAVLGVVFASNNGVDSGWAIASEEVRAAIEASKSDSAPSLSC